MGLIDFVKSAGRMLGIGGGDDAADAETLKKSVSEHGLDVGGLDIKVEGDKVILDGEAKSQEEKEKIIVALGNNQGIASVEDKAKVAASAPEATYHTVEKGDTLWAIATKAYGNGGKYNAIFEANRPMLSHPDKIYPGQVLRIPPQD